MQETLAAMIIRLSGWNGNHSLYDPMCGSGTLLSEALMKYCRIPAGMFRKKFGFEHMPDFDTSLWAKFKRDTDRRVQALPDGLISGSDISGKAITATRKNLRNLPGGNSISLERKDFASLDRAEERPVGKGSRARWAPAP